MSTREPLHPDDVRMSFGDHLEELRKRVLWSLAGVAVACLLTIYYGDRLLAFVIEPLNHAQRQAGVDPRVNAFGIATVFAIYFKVALLAGLILASPWVLYQLWKFVAAGLYAHERRVAHLIMPLSAAMTAIGLLFMYSLMLPICLAFFLRFTVGLGPPGGEQPGMFDWVTRLSASFATSSSGDQPNQWTDLRPPDDPNDIMLVPRYEQDPLDPHDGQAWINLRDNALKVRLGERIMIAQLTINSLIAPMYDINQYIDFVLLITLGVVVGFQLPVVVLISGWTGVVDPRLLSRYRKYCVFVCFCLGALLTPADPISMFALSLPLWALFELGLFLSHLVYQRSPENAE